MDPLTMSSQSERSIVFTWLQFLEMEKYYEGFIDNGYDDFETIKQMGRDDLEIISVQESHIEYLLAAVTVLRRQGAAWVYLLNTYEPSLEQGNDVSKGSHGDSDSSGHYTYPSNAVGVGSGSSSGVGSMKSEGVCSVKSEQAPDDDDSVAVGSSLNSIHSETDYREPDVVIQTRPPMAGYSRRDILLKSDRNGGGLGEGPGVQLATQHRRVQQQLQQVLQSRDPAAARLMPPTGADAATRQTSLTQADGVRLTQLTPHHERWNNNNRAWGKSRPFGGTMNPLNSNTHTDTREVTFNDEDETEALYHELIDDKSFSLRQSNDVLRSASKIEVASDPIEADEIKLDQSWYGNQLSNQHKYSSWSSVLTSIFCRTRKKQQDATGSPMRYDSTVNCPTGGNSGVVTRLVAGPQPVRSGRPRLPHPSPNSLYYYCDTIARRQNLQTQDPLKLEALEDHTASLDTLPSSATAVGFRATAASGNLPTSTATLRRKLATPLVRHRDYGPTMQRQQGFAAAISEPVGGQSAQGRHNGADASSNGCRSLTDSIGGQQACQPAFL